MSFFYDALVGESISRSVGHDEFMSLLRERMTTRQTSVLDQFDDVRSSV